MREMKAGLLFVLFILYVDDGEALRCWKCHNARSNDDCLKFGNLQQCQTGQSACRNEVRRFANGTLSITKSCQHAQACGINYIRHRRADWDQAECNWGVFVGTCRCCCSTEGCNKLHLECSQSSCLPLRNPANGHVACTDSNNVGSVCTFHCDADCDVDGNSKLSCSLRPGESVGTWDHSPPTCQCL